MDTDILVALIGLIGVGLGAFLSGVAYFLKVRSERMKTKNNIVYHLLMIRKLLRLQYVDPRELSKQYFSCCEVYFEKKGIDFKSGFSPELERIILAHFKSLVDAIRPPLAEGFVSALNNAVSALASDDPVLAFQLSGRERVGNLLEAQSEYLKALNAFMLSDEAFRETRDPFSHHVTRLNFDAISILMEDIDSDIMLVCRKTGLLNLFSIRKIMKDSGRIEVNIDPKEVCRVMDGVFAAIKDGTNESSEPSASEAQTSV
ncbi:hypothetical protein [Isoalcanivorax indicus]|uniref:hypothetical protein n=1 Tax=Isoalcanivorax indicus TaxID=2202653 RepID=UPI000DB8FBB2|nr:hypothetical protein [Isoalcanivorax indicus]